MEIRERRSRYRLILIFIDIMVTLSLPFSIIAAFYCSGRKISPPPTAYEIIGISPEEARYWPDFVKENPSYDFSKFPKPEWSRATIEFDLIAPKYSYKPLNLPLSSGKVILFHLIVKSDACRNITEETISGGVMSIGLKFHLRANLSFMSPKIWQEKP